MKRSPRSRKRPSEKQPKKGNHDDGADDVRRYRSEQRAEGRERSGAAGGGVAGVHREDGHLVAAGDYKIGKAKAVDARDRAARRGPLVRARRRWEHV